MNLFFHWLRWDLRRFRWLLLAWTALLVAFSMLLWYQNANLRFIQQNALKNNEFFCFIIGVFALFLLIRILASDPALGTKPFWKSRPPSGYAVSGAKLVLCTAFFLLLPMSCWWLVLKASGISQERVIWGGNHTWMSFLWFAGCIGVGAITFAATAAGGPGGLIARLITAGLATIGLVGLVAAWRVWQGEFPPYPGEFSKLDIWLSSLYHGLRDAKAPWLGLLASAVVFLMAKRRRAPGVITQRAHLVLPAAALIAGANLAGPATPKLAIGPHPNPEKFQKMRLLAPKLRDVATLLEPQVRREDQNEPIARLGLQFSLALAPEGYVVGAEDLELELVTHEGPAARNWKESIPWSSQAILQSGELNVVWFEFRREDLAPLSLMPCQAKGMLKLIMRKRHDKTVPVKAGQEMEIPAGQFFVTDVSAPRDAMDSLVRVSLISGQLQTYPFFWLRKGGAGPEVPIYTEFRSSCDGYLLASERHDWALRQYFDIPPLQTAGYLRDAATGKSAEWDLGASWYEEEGYIERAFTIDNLVIPRMSGDQRKAEDILDALEPTAVAGSEALTRQVQFALGLIDACKQDLSPFDAKDPLLQALSRYLEKISPEHRQLLVALAEKDLPPGNMGSVRPYDQPFTRRIAAMMNADHVAALRATKPQIVRYLRFDLANRNLIPYKEAHGPDWDDMSDEEILQSWEKTTQDRRLHLTALSRAVIRGLPWVPTVVAELAELAPWSRLAPGELTKLMAKKSDCPADHTAGTAWLQQNAARLIWNPTTKRWGLSTP